MYDKYNTFNLCLNTISTSQANTIDPSPDSKNVNLRLSGLPFLNQNGSYLFLIYMFIKFLYVLNIICQMVLMDLFFGFRNYSYGIDFLRKFLSGEDYSRIDKAFPRFLS